MAIGVIMDFDGAGPEQYDQVIEKMGLASGGDGPPGSLSHWVAETDSGLRVVDSWESREAFESFAQEQIIPYATEVGLGQPKMELYELHNTLRGVPSS